MSTKDTIISYIRAGYTGLWMQTAEEARAERLIREAAKGIGDIPDQDPMSVYAWSFTQGFHGSNGFSRKAAKNPEEALLFLDPTQTQRIPDNSLVLLKDFHSFLEDVGIVRKLRDLLAAYKDLGSVIVILSPVLTLKPEIEKDMVVVELPLPGADEFAQVLDEMIEQNPKLKKQGGTLYGVPRDSLLDGLAGLTLTEADNVLALTIVKHGTLDDAALKTIHREKAHVLKRGGLLRYKETDRQMNDIGGLDNLKQWFVERMTAYTPEAREAGLPLPKGVLLVGVQGCGKSLAAEAVANLYHAPLIEGSIGDVMGSLVGESERKMKEMTATADAIGKCVLRLDEFEKMAQGAESSGRSDAGTTSRVLKEFLTWLNDRKSSVFVVATVNRLDALPAEIVRKGRFDEIFFVDLPTKRERVDIFKIHLKRQKLGAGNMDLTEMVETSSGFSGAEIEQAIISARYRAFSKKRSVTSSDILVAISETRPLSVTMREQIEAVRDRLKDVAVPASSPESVATEPTKGGRKLKG